MSADTQLGPAPSGQTIRSVGGLNSNELARLADLLGIYTAKLETLFAEVLAVQEKSRLGSISTAELREDSERRDRSVRRFRNLQPQLEQLARDVSGIVEAAQCPPAIRIELRVRLADFMSRLDDLKDLFKAHSPH
ncbi:MAG TPA: hypothetical protein VHR66_09740 [Gemmataceae bacterium]|jgi:hypothetical protein|nr:hypothetical protein [Gemmataceae bacterium]